MPASSLALLRSSFLRRLTRMIMHHNRAAGLTRTTHTRTLCRSSNSSNCLFTTDNLLRCTASLHRHPYTSNLRLNSMRKPCLTNISPLRSTSSHNVGTALSLHTKHHHLSRSTNYSTTTSSSPTKHLHREVVVAVAMIDSVAVAVVGVGMVGDSWVVQTAYQPGWRWHVLCL
jgi:hypothetical protein